MGTLPIRPAPGRAWDTCLEPQGPESSGGITTSAPTVPTAITSTSQPLPRRVPPDRDASMLLFNFTSTHFYKTQAPPKQWPLRGHSQDALVIIS